MGGRIKVTRRITANKLLLAILLGGCLATAGNDHQTRVAGAGAAGQSICGRQFGVTIIIIWKCSLGGHRVKECKKEWNFYDPIQL